MGIFKAYDIRGIYGENLTEKEAYKIGFYLAKYLNLNEIKIGYDTRVSSESLTKYLMKGFIDANCQVICVGMLSTPNFYFSLFSQNSSTGVMVTASHNSKEYNGFKIIFEGNSFDSRNGLYNVEKLVVEDLLELSEHFDGLHLEKVTLSEFISKNNIVQISKKEDYVQYLSNSFNNIFTEKEKKTLRTINFSIDFSSGMSSIAVSSLFEKLEVKFNSYNDTCDGNFPNHSPDPIKAQDYLKKIENNSEFTVAFDGDGDRIVLYDEKNEVVLPDYMIALLIDYFSKENKEFVCDLRASKILLELAEERNVNLKLMRVGRAFYTDFMKEKDCFYGAELSGHMFFKEFNYLDNPDLALIYLLKIICIEHSKEKEFKFSKVIEKYMKYYKIPEVCIKVENLDDALKKVFENYKDNLVMEIDGYSFEFEKYWFNIRKSNTESVLKINIEGITKEIVEEKMKNLQKLISE